MNTNDFIITVTNNIEGCPIERYLDTICANVVVGTNIFSDFAASISDIFGGFSSSYENKLELIYNEATKELKNKAKKIGANAILGFSIDFDEVSGKGKSMFMVSVSGTACVIKHQNKNITEIKKTGIVSQDFIDTELTRRLIIEAINSGLDIESNWEEFLYEHPQKDIVENLITRYKNGYVDLKEKAFIERYLTLLPISDVADIIYPLYLENSIKIKPLITRCNIFSPKHVLEIIKQDIHLGISLLEAKKDFYQEEDLVFMKEISKIIETLPDTGKIETVKGGFFSKDEEKYICQNEHENSKDEKFCKICGLNIKGLNLEEENLTILFQQTISILEDNL